MEPNLSYDDQWAFFSFYTELFALYDEEGLPCHHGSGDIPRVFSSRSSHAPGVIATLMAQGRLPVTDDLEFLGWLKAAGTSFFTPFARTQDQTLPPPK